MIWYDIWYANTIEALLSRDVAWWFSIRARKWSSKIGQTHQRGYVSNNELSQHIFHGFWEFRYPKIPWWISIFSIDRATGGGASIFRHTFILCQQKNASTVQPFPTLKKSRRSSSLTRTVSGDMWMLLNCPTATRTGHSQQPKIPWLILVDPNLPYFSMAGFVGIPRPWHKELPAAQQSDALRLALLAKYGGVWAQMISVVDDLRVMWRDFPTHLPDWCKVWKECRSHHRRHEHSANNLCLYFPDPFAAFQHLCKFWASSISSFPLESVAVDQM